MADGQGRAVTANERARFLEHLEQTANVTASADLVGRHRNTMYDLRAKDDAFAALWDAALEAATDTLEAEARRRALHGTEEYITCKDGLVLDADNKPVMQRRYSDTMMALLLKAHRPDRFRERASVDMNVSGDLAALIDEGRKRAQRGE